MTDKNKKEAVEEVVESTDDETQTTDEIVKDNDDKSEELVDTQESELSTLKEENEKLEDQVLRYQAEIANMKRIHTKERQDAAKFRSQSLASELLESLDNLERAMATEIKSEDGQALKDGIDMVYKQILQAFEKEDITVIDPEGEEFDPNFHQAVSMMPGGEEAEPNTVLQVLQKGYLLKDRVIRPAMVIVAE